MENTKETRSGMLRHYISCYVLRSRCIDGWMCFILACHAVITLGVV